MTNRQTKTMKTKTIVIVCILLISIFFAGCTQNPEGNGQGTSLIRVEQPTDTVQTDIEVVWSEDITQHTQYQHMYVHKIHIKDDMVTCYIVETQTGVAMSCF